jgi:hypothetical protein
LPACPNKAFAAPSPVAKLPPDGCNKFRDSAFVLAESGSPGRAPQTKEKAMFYPVILLTLAGVVGGVVFWRRRNASKSERDTIRLFHGR